MAWLNEQSLPSLQVVVSDRAKEVSLSLRSTGLSMKAIPANAAEGGFLCLGANFAEISGAPQGESDRSTQCHLCLGCPSLTYCFCCRSGLSKCGRH